MSLERIHKEKKPNECKQNSLSQLAGSDTEPLLCEATEHHCITALHPAEPSKGI